MDGVNETNEPTISGSSAAKVKSPAQKWSLIAALTILALLLIGELLFTTLKYRGHRQIGKDDGLASNDARSMTLAANGDLWLGHWRSVSQISGELFRNYSTDDGIGDVWIVDIAAAPNGDIWVSGYLNGFEDLARYNGQEWIQYPEASAIDTSVRTLAVAPSGNVWFGTADGLVRFDGQEWQIYSFDKGLLAGGVKDIAFPATGGAWFAGIKPSGGLAFFDGQSWRYISSANDLEREITTIKVANDGIIWVGTYDGLGRYDGLNWSTYTTKDGLLDNWINEIAFGPGGMVWVATEKGVSRFDGESWRSLAPLSPECPAKEMVIDEQNHLYFTLRNCASSILGLEWKNDDGLRVYDPRRIMVPTGVIGGWYIARITLAAAFVVLLIFLGIDSSNVRVSERLKAALKPSLIINGLVLVGAVGLIVLSSLNWSYNNFQGSANGIVMFMLVVMAIYGITVVIGAAAGVLVGLVQKDSLTATRIAAVIASLSASGWAGFLLFLFSFMQG